MPQLFKNFLHLGRSRRPRDLVGNPGEDQLNLRNAHRNSSTSLGRRATASADAFSSLDQKHRDLALKLRPSFPQTCSWLEQPDLQVIGESPVASGRFADVRKGRLSDGRQVAVKSYRRYIRFDCDRVRLVSYTSTDMTHTDAITPHPAVLPRSTCIQPPLTSQHHAIRGGIQHPRLPVLLGFRPHGTSLLG